MPTPGGSDLPWWQALPLQMAALLTSLGRSLWLLLLFAPVLLSAPVALQLQFRRAEWIELLRKTLEAAGGWTAGVGKRDGWVGVAWGDVRRHGEVEPRAGMARTRGDEWGQPWPARVAGNRGTV